MENRIRKELEQAVLERVFPGAVVGMYKKGKRMIVPVGSYTYEAPERPMQEDSIFDVASITKAIPVSCLALKLLDEGSLRLTDKIVQFLPELRTNYNDAITVRQVLTQTLNFSVPLSSLKNATADEIIASIFRTQFSLPPGKHLNYSNATSILLALVIERVSGKALDVLADEVFFQPLGMNATSFHPEQLAQEKIIPTEDDPWRKRVIQGEIHDESAFVLRKIMLPGSAGLFSTVPDLLTFLQMLLQNGEYRGKRYLSKKIITAMASNQLGEIGESGGLGWELFQPRFMGHFCTEHTFGKTGFTGCLVLADLEKHIGIVLLSNYHFPKRKNNAKALNRVRRAVVDIVFS